VVAADHERWLGQILTAVRGEPAPKVEQRRAEQPEQGVKQPGTAARRLAKMGKFLP
ncbi:uncharacterized protein METZ01_LOCUS57734, partial [marine metagenome]